MAQHETRLFPRLEQVNQLLETPLPLIDVDVLELRIVHGVKLIQ